ncbi:hypothetical protein J5Y09_16000 [Roseomonas sp. PWR1]|uniref:Uncharacterized protein n=1 Tax=Roseomonas nitratireducens TaxID=2820810 RepID=A0ABS4AVP9_9PROT|nr:hypothetical protein [Neoroseomonas nitratireducens]MBP0465429.1 hypothetical protein [Neoroseomonas nitratireducens]
MVGRPGITVMRRDVVTTSAASRPDEYLHDDFTFATRDGLIPEVRRVSDADKVRAKGLNAP